MRGATFPIFSCVIRAAPGLTERLARKGLLAQPQSVSILTYDDDDDLYFALFTLNLHYICRSKL